MSTAPTLIQIALDFSTIDQAIACARLGVEAGVDILEVGTPLIVAQGPNTIGQLKRAFPDYPVLADYKTMDSGGKNTHLTQAQGGQYMTVCGNAPDETVQAAVAASKETGVKVVVDMIGCKNVAQRAAQCEAWGVDMLYLHYGADQRREGVRRQSTQVVGAGVGAGKIAVWGVRRRAAQAGSAALECA